MKRNGLPAQPNRSLLEGINVLLAVAHSNGPRGVRELARELGMTSTRLQRYLATLAGAGLTQQTEDRRYEVGPGIHALSAISAAASGLACRALDVLPDLDELNLQIALGVIWRGKMTYLYHRHPSEPRAQAIGHLGGFPADQSAIGRVLLSQQSAEQYAQSCSEMRMQGIEFDEEALWHEVALAREQGYALIDRPKSGEETLAIGVGDPFCAGLAVTGAVANRLEELLPRLRKAADTLIV